MSASELIGWDRLRHGGLLLDTQRLRDISAYDPGPLSSFHERELRRMAAAVVDGSGDVPAFVTFVLQNVCGFSDTEGTWQRGSSVPAERGRVAVTGETVTPRQLWRGYKGGVLPVFMDREQRIGIGRGRKVTSQVLQWLRASNERLAVITNGRQWRLVFAGLDFDAWCEWDLDLWFEEGTLSPQVTALRVLLSPVLWTPVGKDAPSPLLQAIFDSRKGQAELSAVLGERVREAVELLVQGHGEALREHCEGVAPAEIYRAAVRVVMRMVVVLFAESRELLPQGNALYHGSYGLTGLLEDLEKIASRGGSQLACSWTAWPRMLSLFRLVHQGSHHPLITVPAYGGELFAPGSSESLDGVSKALAVFESACYDRELFPDREVHRMLDRITRTRIKVRQGRSSTWVLAPVDFSDLSSEYIGILYEGLLDFELKTAPAGDPVVFLAVGNQPALPLSRLEAMDEKALSSLLEKMKDTSSSDDKSEEVPEAEADEENPAEGEEGAQGQEEAEPEPAEVEKEPGDERHTTRTRAETWARRAVEVCKLVKKLSGAMTPEKRLRYEDDIARKARQLVMRVILPGEWYLVRWGGTRKGSGTFYTRPGLAVPTVQRTLRPLAFNAPAGLDGKPDRDAPPAAWTPKKPEEILALKVCDLGCGSGSFPVAALRFLTDAVYASLHHHGRITADGDRSVVRLLSGEETKGGAQEERLGQELLPCRPDDDLFEPRLKAVLRRHVVERCIYGVDLDPLAVELCRLSLWIETMDRSLPFSFLDHKVKCGNSLVGAWFDQFQHYPAMAWKNREGGDKSHSNGVHFQVDERTKAIKTFVKDKLTPDLIDAITGQVQLFSPASATPQGVHDKALALLEHLHEMPVHDAAERARIYRDELLGSSEYRSLKDAMDLWCACWFWPVDELENAPLPTSFARPSEATRAIAARLAAEKRLFHWELEFPDVFRATGSGFDAVVGNPPWDIAKPNSKEFFSNIDPLYRSYGKQEALRYQTEYFSNVTVERSWLDYSADFRSQSNFAGYCANAFGDPVLNESVDRFTLRRGNDNLVLHTKWRNMRAKSTGYADPSHSFCHQGSADVNLYKLFLEQAHALLKSGGRLGFIVPSGLYSDHGTGGLRQLFLDRCRWEWLFGFENRDGIFEIHRSYKFNPIIIQKGGKTEFILTAFMRHKLEDWEHAEALATLYSRAQVERFSPWSKAILEIQSQRDLEILEKIYANCVLLGDDGPDGWGIKYATEFHMTNDSHLFPPRPKWEAEGYRPDEYSRWLKGDWRPIAELWTELGVKPLPEGKRRCAQPPYDTLPIPRADIPSGIILSREADAWIRAERIDDVALPLMQGAMVLHFDYMAAAYESGAGQKVRWHPLAWDRKVSQPQFLMAASRYRDCNAAKREKIGFRGLSNPTNRRTWISSIIPNYPCGNMLPLLSFPDWQLLAIYLFSAITNSYVYDFQVRKRFVGGTGAVAMTLSALEETALPKRSEVITSVAYIPARLSLVGANFAASWLRLIHSLIPCTFNTRNLGSLLALTPHERLRTISISDAISASFFNLESHHLAFILSDCDHPCNHLLGGKTVEQFDAKGFWRVDKDKDPELRHTVLTLVAFHDLEEKIRACGGDRDKGIEAFLSQNDGEGWMLPETLRLADYGLGHDERAKEPQPVASRIGPRFYDWQLAQTPEDSWRECHLHARNLLGEEGYKKLLDEIEGKTRDGCGTSESKPVEIREPGADCQDLPLFRSKT